MSEIVMINPATGEELGVKKTWSAAHIFDAYKKANEKSLMFRTTTIEQRIKEIRKIKHYIVAHMESLVGGLSADLGKTKSEALLMEIFPVLDCIKYYEKNTQSIHADEKIKTPIALIGKKSFVFYEPLGTILIIAPWNAPFTLSLIPIHRPGHASHDSRLEYRSVRGGSDVARSCDTRVVAIGWARAHNPAGSAPRECPMNLGIVIVEDNPNLRAGLEVLFSEESGFHLAAGFPNAVALLESAEEIVKRHGDPAWDLVLMDIELPRMSGIEATSRLKQLMPQVPVVVTVFEKLSTILDAICAGTDGYLLKKTPVPELLAQLRSVVGGGSPFTPGVASAEPAVPE